MTLFHQSLDRAILLVTLLRPLRLQKIDFRTFQLGIAQLVPRVLGSPSTLPAPKTREKKKIPKKKFRTRPPPRPLLIGNWRERSEKISKSLKSFPKSLKEFRQATKPLSDVTRPWAFSRAPVLALAVATARPASPTRTAPCTKSQPIKSHLTAPLLTLANYLYTYIIRLLPHSSAPGYFVSLSPIRLVCPGVNMISNPYPLLFFLLLSVFPFNFMVWNIYRPFNSNTTRSNWLHERDASVIYIYYYTSQKERRKVFFVFCFTFIF